jgi:hypothetical protein
MRSLGLALLLGVSCCLPTPGGEASPSAETVPEAVRTITGREIGGHLRFLASDLMKGRDTASPESRLAGEYLAAHLFAAGAEPLGEPGVQGRTYFQTFPIESVTPLDEGTDLTLLLETHGIQQTIPCKLGRDLIVRPFGIVPGEVEASVAFAGFGRVHAETKIDDYAGLDVLNQFVLIYDGSPDPPKDKDKADSPAQAPVLSSFEKVAAAQKRGAVGLIVMQPPGRKTTEPQVPFNARNLGFGRPRMSFGTPAQQGPLLHLGDNVRDTLVKSLGLTAESKPQALQRGRLRARFRFAARREPRSDRNVLGFFPGSDPEKKKEIVIFSAHYDHVGVNEAGEIFNGSDDNGSGTSSLLEIAQAFGQGPRPARSVAFLWVSGEEKGLVGSHWFADHLTLPAEYKLVADINLDMVSRNDPKKIGITPSPKHAEYNSLVPCAQASCKAEGLEAVFNADSFFFRTDSSSFARKGVPVIFFFAGVHADYHRPTDDFEKADIEKAARVARAAYRLAWQIAQDREVPKKIKADSKVESTITSQ